MEWFWLDFIWFSDMPWYNVLVDKSIPELVTPHLTIYLDTPVDVCMKNIKARGRVSCSSFTQHPGTPSSKMTWILNSIKRKKITDKTSLNNENNERTKHYTWRSQKYLSFLPLSPLSLSHAKKSTSKFYFQEEEKGKNFTPALLESIESVYRNSFLPRQKLTHEVLELDWSTPGDEMDMDVVGTSRGLGKGS